MWRNKRERARSARSRLDNARRWWGWTPHRKQRAFFVCDAQIRAAACGRRWGKTEALGIDLATLALECAAQGRDCRQLTVAPTEAQARLIGAETARRLRAALDADPALAQRLTLTERIRPYTLTLTARDGPHPPAPSPEDGRRGDRKDLGKDQSENPLPDLGEGRVRATSENPLPSSGEGRVRATSENPLPSSGEGRVRAASAPVTLWFRTAGRDGRGLRGLSAHRIVVDEAAYVPDAVLSEVLMPMLADAGGELTLASTPAGRGGVFFRVFARGDCAPKVPDPHGLTYAAFQCPSPDNPHLDRAFLAGMAEELGESRYAQEIAAQFVDDFGAVFPQTDIDKCLAADPWVTLENGDLTSLPQDGHRYAVGIDWGRKRDFTVVCVLDWTASPMRLVALRRMQGTGWETQAARAAELIARFLPKRTLADASGLGDAVQERLDAAIAAHVPEGEGTPPVEPFTFTPVSKQNLIDRLSLGLGARALTFPSHPALVRELRGFEYQGSSTTGRFRMAASGAGHDDCVIALALAYQAAPTVAPRAPGEALMLASALGE